MKSVGSCRAAPAWRSASRWTSSGPSASRSVRASAQARPGKSPLTPAPPWAWMARSITRSAMLGATTLIIAISGAAALLPTVSIRCAAFSVSSRACSISMRESAMSARIVPCSASGLPKATRELDPPAHRLQRALGQADQPHAVVDAPRPEPALGDLEAPPLAEEDVRRRHADVLEEDLGVAVRGVVVAEHGQHRLTVTPGASIGTRIIDCCWCGGASGSVLPMKMAILQRGSPAPEVHHLRPLMTYSSPWRSMRGADVGGVGGGDVRLGHGEAGADFAGEQRFEPAAASAPAVP